MHHHIKKGENLTHPAPYARVSGDWGLIGFAVGIASGDALVGVAVKAATNPSPTLPVRLDGAV